MSELVERLRAVVGAGDNADLAEVRRLLAAGADPNTKNSIGTGSMLCMAAYAGNLELARVLLAGGADPNLPDEAPLVLALRERRYEMAALLVEWHADVNHGAGSHQTALNNLIAFKPETKAVEWLLQRGADPNGTDQHGGVPLFSAARDGLTEIAAALVAAGADVRYCHRFDTALGIARWYKHAPIVKLLEDAGATE